MSLEFVLNTCGIGGLLLSLYVIMLGWRTHSVTELLVGVWTLLVSILFLLLLNGILL